MAAGPVPDRSRDRSGDVPAAPRVRGVPRWLTPAAGSWVMLTAGALANATPLAFPAEPVVVVLAGLALAHGLVHRRWRVAGPLGVLLLAAAVASAVAGSAGLVTADAPPGAAEQVAVRAIWTVAPVVAGLDIAWALVLHRRGARAAASGHQERLHALSARMSDASSGAASELAELERRVDAVEQLLTTVP